MMIANITLRPVTTGDQAFLFRAYAGTRLHELADLGWSDAQKHEFIDFQFRAQHADYTERFPDAEHSIVLRDGEAVGRVWIDRREEEIRLLDIALLPERQSQGIGGELLSRLQAEAGEAGKPLRHSVAKDNPDALRFYRRLGFTVVEDWGMHELMEWIPPGDDGRESAE